MCASEEPGNELERLRSENEALHEQLKLLVQMEQRLYRFQNKLDAQLVRLRSLASFALESPVESIDSILARGMDVLSEGFTLDWVGVVRIEPGAPRVTIRALHEATSVPEQPVALDADAMACLADQRVPSIAEDVFRHPDEPPYRVVAALAPGLVPRGGAADGGRVACVPLRSVGDERRGAILAFVGVRGMALVRDSLISDEHVPFLQLLANHVDHQIANVRLNASLTERSAELAASLETLESTQQQLIQAQKLEAVGRLAGGVAHDFNNLLTVILGYAGTLQGALPEGRPERANVDHIMTAGQRAADITSQLLALSRRQIQRPEPVDLSGHTRATLDLLRRAVGERIRLELQLDPALPPIRADRAQLEQVLLNLVLNARDALPEGGDLRVLTRRATADDAARCTGDVDPARFALLGVEDSGVGMDQATQERIFEPFFSTKDSGKGSGLGLAVVYGIVKQSDGHVFVDSAPGRGSRFSVLLPFDLPGARGSTADAARPVERPLAPRERRTLLVVEDEPAIREVIVLTLRGAGYHVLTAGDGVKALETLRGAASRPDLILTDVVMPDLGGIELGRELRRRGDPTPLVYMSGYSDKLPEALADDAGASAAFLPKPFSPGQLLDFVARQFQPRAVGQEPRR